MTFVLDAATTVNVRSDGRYQVAVDERFWNGDHAFGGWTAAVTVAAWQAEQACRGELVTQNIQFHAAIKGPEVLVETTLVERRRSVDFWHVAVLAPSREHRVLAAATLVAGQRRDSEIGFERRSASYRPQKDSFRLQRQPVSPSWFDHYEIYLAIGRPFAVNESPHSVTYVRESDGRALDAKALTAMLDTPMPRTFFCGERLPFSSTVAMSTHIYASDAELATAGDGFITLDVDCQTIRHGFLNQECRAYRDDGLLLAVRYQTGFYREEPPSHA